MSPGLFQDFLVFVPCVTQGNEDTGSVQDFNLLFWCDPRELECRGSPRFPCVTPVVESFSSRLSSSSNKLLGSIALTVWSNIYDGAPPRK